MKRTFSVWMILVVALSVSAFGQLKYGTDFTTSDQVLSVTHVKVDSNRIPYYLEGIKQTWASANEVSRELGHIDSWSIYSSLLPESGAYNLTLVIRYRDMAQYEKGRKEFKEFEEAWLKKISEEKREEIVKTYPNMREIVGEYLIRQVEFK